ncbi:NAD(P)/FAD-dependent oxidoreductase [Halobacillus hunanensis]|uniref:NAD(P)/FAD-dependent oxidoreductase n=1 Tax=Halobacillus hunanensis TaxID=578214 RepID=UPI001115B2D5|nr:FAD-dependent oxidoreductase [Halobacillus hunanensis]
MQKYDVAVVGAGLSGIVAARKLKQAGASVLLLEKEETVGGRLATSITAEGKADIGAQFFTVRTEELQQEVEEWLERGWVKRWFGEDYPRYTSVDGMSSLACRLAEGVDTVTSTLITTINARDSYTELHDESGSLYKCKQVLSTLPAPLTANLIGESSFDLKTEAYQTLKEIQFQPTYVGIFQFDQSPPLPENGHIDKQLPAGVERIVDHQKKGISKTPLISVYMTANWSALHESGEPILKMIKNTTFSYLDFQTVVSQQLEIWPYAQASATYHRSFLEIDNQGKLLVAGDAFLRPDDQAGRTRFESAFLSGQDAAAHVLSDS